MRDSALAPPSAPPLTGGLADSLFARAAESPTLPVLARRTGPASATWEEVTAVEFRDEVVDLAKGLIASGISPGTRVAIMARTRYEWTVLCHALWTVGAEVVPIYPTSSREQVEWILRDSGAVAVLVEDEQSVMTVGSVCAALPRLRHVWQLDAGALQQLAARGEAIPPATVDSMRRIVLPDATAVVAYTSGTSGHAMGCALSHRGLAFICDTLLEGWGHVAAAPGEQGSVLAFLPFSHVYGLMIQSLCVRGGLLMGHEPDLGADALSSALRTFQPTYLYAVPSLLEKIYKNFLRASQLSGRGALFERAAGTARDFAAATERRRLGRGSGPGLDLRMQHALYERTVYRKLRATLGGRVRRATSGVAAQPRPVALLRGHRHLRARRLRPHRDQRRGDDAAVRPGEVRHRRAGAAGDRDPGGRGRGDPGARAVGLPGVRGRSGRHPGHAARRLAGHGDLGRLDTEGYLTITGRKKDIIITTSGKSVAPAALEQRLRMHPLVHQAVVVGDNRPCVGALITLDPDFLADWRAALSLPGDAPAREAREENALREEIGRAVAAANSSVSPSESIRVFRVLPEPFDVTNGLLTPSMKLRRDEIVRRYALEIDAMYQSRRRPERTPVPEESSAWDDADNVFR